MKSEQCTYSLGTEVDYLQTSFWDTNQFVQSNWISTPAKSSENEQQMDGSQVCQCGKGTLDCSIHPSTREKWIASMLDSLVRTLAWLESRQAYLREPDQAFTAKSCASLAWFDRDSYSWKTWQQSLVTGWEPYSETWPRWGTTVAGCAFVHPMSERRITETDGLLWPTPNAAPLTNNTDLQCSGDGRTKPNKLGWAVAMFPIPNASDCRDRGNMSTPSVQRRAAIGKQLNLSMVVSETSGALNPTWVEWLMGFPIGFTVLKDWEMPKSRSKQQSPTDCSEVSE